MNTSLEFLVFTTLSILSISFLLIKRFFSTTTKLPPSPPSLPFIGNLHNMGRRHPHRSLHRLSRRYGPLMLLRFGGVPVIVVSSPDGARDVMKTHDLAFSDRPRSAVFEKLLYDHKDIAAAPYGEYWRQTKAISTIHLLSTARVKSFRHVRAEETETLMAKIKASTLNSVPVNLSEAFAKLTNDVVCRAALGEKFDDDEHGKLERLLGEFVELLGYVDVGDYIKWLWWVRFVSGVNGRMERVMKELDEVLDGVLEEHMGKWKFDENDEDFGALDSKVDMDFVDVLLWIQRKNSTSGFHLDRACLKALLLDSFAAGTDTTYTVLEWAMTELLRHPSAMKKLRAELTQVSGENMNITEDDLDKFQYLRAVIKETLRLHPPIPLLVPRLSRKDVNIQGYHIPARTQVMINAWSIGRDPGWWERPEEFLPDRFLESADVDFRGQHFQLVPFGSGRRSCPGVAFAMAVNEVVLANVVRRFEWRLVEDGEEMDMEESEGITIHRKFPLIAIPFAAS